ncbi:profilin, required for normal timing of actin polymerization in response to thermal stress, partial [Haplosporangium sp. Z 27]
MSWQAYVDTNLVSTGKVDKGAIFGLDASLWATSADFKVGGAEVKKLVAAFTDPTDVATNGLFLEGEKYIYLRSPADNIIYARKGTTGVVAVKTKQAVILGHYNEHIAAGDCNGVVEGLAHYLEGVGY